MDMRTIFVLVVNFRVVFPSFLSGTVSWEPKGVPSNTEVIFHGRYGFQFGLGPGCKQNLTGSYVNSLTNSKSLACTHGCTPAQTITHGDLNYYCGSYDSHWEQGDKFFSHPFPSTNQYTVSYRGNPWIHHDFGAQGNVNFQTTIDLRTRSDTNRPNSSPVTSSLPIYKIPFDCITSIQIPVYDPDSDAVSCRLAAGVECGQVCNGLPKLNLDEQRCILTVQPMHVTGFIDNGTYIVTLVVEDFPKTTITVGNTTKHQSNALSQVPLQFVIRTPKVFGGCTHNPTVTDPTPKNGQVFIVPKNRNFTQKIYARHNAPATSINKFATSVPYGMIHSAITKAGQKWSTQLTWTPKTTQYSTNIMCFQAIDNKGLYSEQHCFTLLTGVEDPCKTNPCEHGGSCAISLDTYICTCAPEYEGRNCTLDVNDCLSTPCQHGGTCWDQVGGYKCFCSIGFMGTECQATDYCASNPCQNFGTCSTTSTGYTCACSPGYTGTNCDADLDECSSSPCENGGTCTDMVGDFFCECPIEYMGKNCSIAHDFCNPNPCENNGVCTNYKDSYRCSCPSGYIGLDCEIYQPESCGVDDDNHCMCLLNGRRVKLPFPQHKSEGFTTEDLVAGVVGIPIGIAFGALMCVIWHKLLRPRCLSGSSENRGSPRQRPASTSSTNSLISRDSTASPSDIRASVNSPIYSMSPTPGNPYRPNLSTDWSIK